MAASGAREGLTASATERFPVRVFRRPFDRAILRPKACLSPSAPLQKSACSPRNHLTILDL